MNTAHRVLKYAALTFALVLAAGIIASIVQFGMGLLNRFGMFDHSTQAIDFQESYQQVQSLDIHCSHGSLTILPAEEARVEAFDVSSSFECKVKDGHLVIKEHGGLASLFDFDSHSKITLYLPKDCTLESAKLSCGAGTVSIEQLITDELELKIGAGTCRVDRLQANEAEIEGGVGELIIQDAQLHNLDLGAGIGKTTLTGSITGDSEISAHIGEIQLSLQGNIDDYYFDLKDGLGNITVDGKSYHNKTKIGSPSASNQCKIKGGIGQITISFDSKA